MDSNQQTLSGIRKTAQMGQTGIESVLQEAVNPRMRQALSQQLREYGEIDRQAGQLERARGWKESGISPAIRMLSGSTAKMRLRFGDTDSKIAGMMIQGSTRGIILGCRNRNHSRDLDSGIQALSQKLLETETANISQMKPFL